MSDLSQRVLVLLFDLSIKAILLAVLADLVLRALRLKAASSHAAWTAMLASLLLLIPLSLLIPGVPVPLFPAPAASPVHFGTPAPAAVSAAEPAAAVAQEIPEAGRDAGQAREPAAGMWKRWLALIYFLGAGLMLARLAVGLHLSRRLVRSGREIVDAELQSACRRLCSVAGLRRMPKLLASPGTRVPLAVGWWKPKVLLPASWQSWDRAKLESVLAHELAHLRRGDHWTYLLASVLRSVYWFHPVAWLIPGRVSLLAEEACDDLAVRWTGCRTSYARHLLEVAAALQGSAARVVFAAMPMARSTQLGQRIDVLLRSEPEAARMPNRKLSALVLLLGFVIMFGAAVVRLEPEAAAGPAGAGAAGWVRDLASPDPQARVQAAVKLRQSGTVAPEAIPGLIALLGDRASTRAVVDDNEEPVGAVTFLHTTPGEEASKTLGTYGDSAVGPLLRVLAAERAEARLDAVAALGRTRSDRAVKPLLPLLRDSSAEVRKMAAWALGTIADPEALAAVAAATQDRDAEVRKMASWAEAKLRLAQPAAAQSFAELQADLHRQDYRLRLAAARRLGQSEDPRAVGALLTALGDEYYAVRLEAVSALGESADPRASAALRQALKDADYRVRLAAVEGLSRRRDGASQEALRGALRDSDYRVRLRAAAKLARWGDAAGFSALEAGLRHEHQHVRILAAQGMGQSAAPAAVAPLVGALKDQDYRVRRSAAEALGALGDRSAIPALTGALEDGQASVRDAAREALERLQAGSGGAASGKKNGTDPSGQARD